MKMSSTRWFIFVSLISFLIKVCDSVSLEEDLSITAEQKLILDEFREAVSDRLPHDYMKTDIYLIRWLRASDFDIKLAEKRLKENLKWREEHRMDSIIFEDWSEFEQEYPYFLEGCDVQGRPVAATYVGDWDVRKAMLSGQREKLIRYSHKLLEEITTLIRLGQDEGKNVTQFAIILNMNNFNLVQNACPLCIPFYISMLEAYELRYPGSAHKAILVNTPPVFQTVLNSILPFVPPRSRDLLVVYGRNKATWQSKVFQDIPKDQLTKDFGGLKESAFTPEYLRKVQRLPC